MFMTTLANVDHFSKKKQEDSVCTQAYHKDVHLTCIILLHYLVKFETQTVLQNVHMERDN